MIEQLSGTTHAFEQLSAWAAELELSAIPDAVLQRAATIGVDDMAAMIAARSEAQVAARRHHPSEARK
jgi:hypothetical protein